MEWEERMSNHGIFNRLDPRDILLDQAKLLREQAARMPPGVERDRLMKSARASEAQAYADRWANSAGLQSPER